MYSFIRALRNKGSMPLSYLLGYNLKKISVIPTPPPHDIHTYKCHYKLSTRDFNRYLLFFRKKNILQSTIEFVNDLALSCTKYVLYDNRSN